MLKNDARRISINAAKQVCYARTLAAVPIMIMNVRINNANATIMTVILRMKKKMMMSDDVDVQLYNRRVNFEKVYKLLRFSGPASLSCLVTCPPHNQQLSPNDQIVYFCNF